MTARVAGRRHNHQSTGERHHAVLPQQLLQRHRPQPGHQPAQPGNLLQAVEGQICQAVNQEWNPLLGSAAQCGLTITGIQFRLRRAGRRALLPEAHLRRRRAADRLHRHRRRGSGSGLYINGTGTGAAGYTLPATPKGTF